MGTAMAKHHAGGGHHGLFKLSVSFCRLGRGCHWRSAFRPAPSHFANLARRIGPSPTGGSCRADCIRQFFRSGLQCQNCQPKGRHHLARQPRLDGARLGQNSLCFQWQFCHQHFVFQIRHSTGSRCQNRLVCRCHLRFCELVIVCGASPLSCATRSVGSHCDFGRFEPSQAHGLCQTLANFSRRGHHLLADLCHYLAKCTAHLLGRLGRRSDGAESFSAYPPSPPHHRSGLARRRQFTRPSFVASAAPCFRRVCSAHGCRA